MIHYTRDRKKYEKEKRAYLSSSRLIKKGYPKKIEELKMTKEYREARKLPRIWELYPEAKLFRIINSGNPKRLNDICVVRGGNWKRYQMPKKLYEKEEVERVKTWKLKRITKTNDSTQ